MRTLSIAFKLLWKRKITNAILIAEVILSIIMLAQLFVYVSNYSNNLNAIKELPQDHAYILNTFEYYDVNDVISALQENVHVESIDRIYMSSAICQDTQCNLVLYSESIISHYEPRLQSGVWLSSAQSPDSTVKSAVVSAEIGVKPGEIVEIRMPGNRREQIYVAGVLQTPTQYLFPSGGASAVNFSADLIIDHYPVVILNGEEFDDLSPFYPPTEPRFPENLFVFFQPNTMVSDIEKAATSWHKFGELSNTAQLIDNYQKNASELIMSGIIFFVVFFFLAVFCVLSNSVIQCFYNRSLFTIYYLLGMNWKRTAVVEIIRMFILVVIISALTVFVGKQGWLMLEWLSPQMISVFFRLTIVYTLLMFASVESSFIIKLTRTDLSGALKELQQGE